jgi:GNAT superfamily N-acetyltransferase
VDSQHSPTFRLAIPEDDVSVVDLVNRQEPEGPTLTLDAYREETSKRRSSSERWIADIGGRVIGVGNVSPAWWTGRTNVFLASVRVDTTHRRQGTGTRMLDLLLSRLAEEGAHQVLAWVRLDEEAPLAFATHHGFRETGQVIEEYILRISEARIDAYADLQDRLESEGIRITTLDNLDTNDPDFLEALHRVWVGSQDPQDAVSLQEWRAQVLDGAGQTPDTHWVALHEDHPVGMTFLKRLSPDAAENDFTSVLPGYRGRGIAQALKVRAISWARGAGLRSFYTSSELGNAPMIAINTRLGYRPGPRRAEVTRDLTPPAMHRPQDAGRP